MARYIKLANGFKMPTLGFGTYLLQGDTLKSALDFALFLGYRHIDTALNYGNECDIGEVLKDRIRNGKLKRKEVFVTSKVPPVYLAYHAALDSARMSLDNLQLKNLDLLLIHQPWGLVNRGDGTLRPLDEKGKRELAIYNLNETWTAMEFLVGRGLVNSIGMSNFTARQVDRVYKTASIKPSNLQLECHCYFQQRELETYCATRDIVISAYAPVGAPGKPDLDPSFDPMLLRDPVVCAVAEECSKTPSQILLNFLIRRNMVALPKSSNFHHIEDNINVFDFAMSQRQIDALEDLDRNHRFFRFEWAASHPEFYDEPF